MSMMGNSRADWTILSQEFIYFYTLVGYTSSCYDNEAKSSISGCNKADYNTVLSLIFTTLPLPLSFNNARLLYTQFRNHGLLCVLLLPPKKYLALIPLKQSSMEMKRRISEISKKVKDMNFSRKTASNSGLKMARSIIFSLPKPCHIIKLNKADKGSDIKIASGLIYCIIITIHLSHADMLGN